jgi:flagellar basal-body rod protein FlgB
LGGIQLLGSIITGSIFQVMEKALDGSALRQKAISANIANVDTPGYKSLEVSFHDYLKSAMKYPGHSIQLKATDSRHIQIRGSAGAPPVMVATEDSQLRNDGNNVDIDREIAKLTSNEIYYDAVSRCLNDEFRLLRSVIQGRS